MRRRRPGTATTDMPRTASHRQSVLAVVGERSLFGRLAGRLNRSALDVSLSHSAQNAIFFTSVLRFELIFVGHPLADAGLDQFLVEVHRSGSPCADTPVLVLARGAEVAALERAHGGPLVEVVAADHLAGSDLEERVNRRLGIGALAASRVPVVLTTIIEAEGRRRRLRSRNLSESGILLQTRNPEPVGTVVQLDLELPGERTQLRLAAEVVRHALPEQERIHGMGLRFVDLRDAQRHALRHFIHQRLRAE
jgi:uncharacterized protein (TIGR02266 family)